MWFTWKLFGIYTDIPIFERLWIRENICVRKTSATLNTCIHISRDILDLDEELSGTDVWWRGAAEHQFFVGVFILQNAKASMIQLCNANRCESRVQIPESKLTLTLRWQDWWNMPLSLFFSAIYILRKFPVSCKKLSQDTTDTKRSVKYRF